MKEELIVKFFAGETEPYELAIIEQWRNESAENEKHFKDLKKVWEMSAQKFNNDEINIDLAWQKVKEKSLQTSKGRMVKFNIKWLAAASVILVLSIGFLFLNRNTKMEFTEVIVVKNEFKNLKLSDGTAVTLKNGSLHYNQHFKGNKRQLHLDSGIAFFNVAKNKNRPFEIAAHSTTIIVVGTQFEINSTSQFTQVTVLEGKVILKTPNGEKILTAGMTAIYNEENKRLESIKKPANNQFAYSTGILKFEGESLKAVFQDLNNYQNKYNLILENKALENCKLTTTFEHENIETILSVISSTFNLIIEKNEQTKTISLKGGMCNE